MFGYMLFNRKTGGARVRTPEEFQQRARQDIESRIESLAAGSPPAASQKVLNGRRGSLGSHRGAQDVKHTVGYAASPLGRTVTTMESSDDCSTIDSGRSGKSLTADSVQRLRQEQQQSLSRIPTNSTAGTGVTGASGSLFDANQLQSIYTASTAPTMAWTTPSGPISLHDALPKDFGDYYSPDLDTPRFSNGRPRYTRRRLRHWELNDTRSLLILPEVRPEWQGKVPHVLSPVEGKSFRIQILPPYLQDEELARGLASSDIYKEAHFDDDFRLRTAAFVVQKARFRHRQVLVSSFNAPEDCFNEANLVGDIQYDCYFKFEWRNIIENFLLNLGIEYQCRSDFKTRMQTLGGDVPSKASGSLYKRTLLKHVPTINEDLKAQVWREVQNRVYASLEDY